MPKILSIVLWPILAILIFLIPFGYYAASFGNSLGGRSTSLEDVFEFISDPIKILLALLLFILAVVLNILSLDISSVRNFFFRIRKLVFIPLIASIIMFVPSPFTLIVFFVEAYTFPLCYLLIAILPAVWIHSNGLVWTADRKRIVSSIKIALFAFLATYWLVIISFAISGVKNLLLISNPNFIYPTYFPNIINQQSQIQRCFDNNCKDLSLFYDCGEDSIGIDQFTKDSEYSSENYLNLQLIEASTGFDRFGRPSNFNKVEVNGIQAIYDIETQELKWKNNEIIIEINSDQCPISKEELIKFAESMK